MRRSGICWMAGVMLLATPLMGQEMAHLQRMMPAKLNPNRPATRDAISGLLHYPKDVRLAALELSQYPDLVINLRYLDPATPGLLRDMTRGYPSSVQQAASIVTQRGDVVATLQQNLLALTSLGRAYVQDRAGVGVLIDQMCAVEAIESKPALDSWAKRMAENATASQQLSAASGELAAQVGGMNFQNDALPTPQQIQFILDHPDRYGELSVLIMDQWETEGTPEPFRKAVDMWYAAHRDVLPDSISGDAATKLKVLREAVAFEHRYAEAVAKTQYGPAPTRHEFMENSEKDFPTLVEVRQAHQYALANSKPVKIAGGPWTGSSGRGGSSRGSGSSSSSSMMGSSRSSRSSRGTGTGLSTGVVGGSRGRNSRNSRDGNSSNSSNSSSRRRNSRNSSGSGGSGGFGGSSGFGGSGGSGGFGGSSGFGGSGGSGGFGGGGSSSFGSGGSRSSRSSFGQ